MMDVHRGTYAPHTQSDKSNATHGCIYNRRHVRPACLVRPSVVPSPSLFLPVSVGPPAGPFMHLSCPQEAAGESAPDKKTLANMLMYV